MKRAAFFLLLLVPILLQADGWYYAGAPTNYLDGSHNIIGAWKFNNNLDDVTGHGQTLICSTFDGSCNYVDPLIEGTKAINSTYCLEINQSSLVAGFPGLGSHQSSVSCGGWFKIETLPTTASFYLINMGLFGQHAFDLVVNTSGKLAFTLYGSGTSTTFTGSSTISAGTAFFAAATWDGSNVNLYYTTSSNPSKDMVQAAYSTAMVSSTGQVFNVLWHNNSANAVADEVWVADAGLTAADITNICNFGLSGDR